MEYSPVTYGVPHSGSRSAVLTDRRLIVIPTYNEADNLRPLLARLMDGFAADVLVVDDNSPDGTGKIADELASASEQIHVLHRKKKSGLASAYVDGFQYALQLGYDIVFQMDADGSHDPAALPLMVGALENCDLVIGSRYVPGGGSTNWSWSRRAISRAGSHYVRALLRLPVRDTTSGFKGWRAELLRKILAADVAASGYVFQIEMTHRAVRMGARVEEVPIQFADRRLGVSKFSSGILAEAMIRVALMSARRLLVR